MLLRNTDPFRDLDRLTQQLLGITSRPVVMPMDAWRQGDRFVILVGEVEDGKRVGRSPPPSTSAPIKGTTRSLAASEAVVVPDNAHCGRRCHEFGQLSGRLSSEIPIREAIK